MKRDAVLERLRGGDAAGALLLFDNSAPDGAMDCEKLAIYGMVLLANDRPTEALSALREAVALGEDAPPTLLNLALAEERTGNTEQAHCLMRRLEQELPEWDEPSLRLAESLRATGMSKEAELAYRRVLEINPRREEALLGLAGQLLLRGDGEGARLLLLRCCGIAPSRAETWDALGLALMLVGDRNLAETAFAEAQRLSPHTLEFALHRVEACAPGDEETLLACLEVASESDPLGSAVLCARGVLLERLGRHAEAADVLEVATTLTPEADLPAIMFADALIRCDRLKDAAGALRRAIELDPDNPLLANNLAAVLMRMLQHAAAREILLESIDKHGEDVRALCNLASATVYSGLQQEAVDVATRAIELAPDDVLPRRTLCNLLPYRDPVSGAELLVALRECSSRLPRLPAPRFANCSDPDRPLIIGVLSGTLRMHPVGWLTIAGFEALDPAEYAVICLVQGSITDSMTGRFRALAREWQEVGSLDDVALTERARSLGIDILIDLGGYGDAGRMTACAHRLAPVQIKWVGMQNHSTGLDQMDWIITDRWETPPELEHVYSERPLRLPDGYVCYSPPPYAPDVGSLPALDRGYITFGCFNNLAKVTPHVINTWCEVLHRVPTARLVLKTHQFCDAPTADRIRAEFAKRAISPGRLELRGPSGHRAFVEEYNGIDIVLDPFPYSGGLSTCEALWMGVPTVTVPGEIFASRHSASHLSNAGLADWVARDIPAYIELAVKKAADVEALAVLRSRLRAQVKASPLCDAPRFGRNLGAALRFAWREWCSES